MSSQMMAMKGPQRERRALDPAVPVRAIRPLVEKVSRRC